MVENENGGVSHPGEACLQVPLRPGNQRPGRAGFLQDGVAAQQTEAQSVWGECRRLPVLARTRSALKNLPSITTSLYTLYVFIL